MIVNASATQGLLDNIAKKKSALHTSVPCTGNVIPTTMKRHHVSVPITGKATTVTYSIRVNHHPVSMAGRVLKVMICLYVHVLLDTTEVIAKTVSVIPILVAYTALVA